METDSTSAANVDMGEVGSAIVVETSSINFTKKISTVWAHIQQNADKVSMCKYCDKAFSSKSTTGNFRRHLNAFHSDKLESVRDQGDQSATSISFDKELATKRFIKWIVCDLQPFTTADNQHFREFVEVLNAQYKIPSADYTKSLIMAQLKTNKGNVMTFLQDLPGSITFTTDIWSSCSQQSYLGITAHFIDIDWVLQHIVIDVEPFPHPHTSEAIAETFLGVLDDFGITTKFHAMVTDNAGNMTKAFSILEKIMNEKYGRNIYHIRCSAHVFHLAVQDGFGIKKDEPPTNPISRLRSSISCIHRSPKLIEELEQLCELSGETFHKPVLDVSTRWNSTYRMLEIALSQRRALDMLIANAGQGSVLKENALTDAHWEAIKETHTQLDIFDKATNVLIGTYNNLFYLHSVRSWLSNSSLWANY